ncbi:replication initiation protein RepC [Octadecabacter arcticus]|uniref:replication initiation protein RepC n=1 Tax=Octadecabacter arcticus TaxID=53946 RepID=UPI000A00D6B5|nr:replication initiation protein RepC [Octadecabacter arcticus]
MGKGNLGLRHIHATRLVRPMVGVSEHAWAVAQELLGPQAAAATMALIFEKFSDGEIASPGGYLRGYRQVIASKPQWGSPVCFTLPLAHT